jgi:hypothetical protein
VLEVERAQEEGGVGARDEKAADEVGGDQAAQTEDAQRHDRVSDAGLKRGEARDQQCRDAEGGEGPAAGPAPFGDLDQGVDAGDRAGRDQDRAEPVDSLTEADAFILCDQGAPEDVRDRPDRQVDEEDPVPADRLGQDAAEQQAERRPAGDHERVEAHRLGSLRGLGELHGDDRDDHRGGERGGGALQEAGDYQRAAAGGEAAEHRGGDEGGDADQKDPLAPEQVAEPPGEQQQAAEGDQVAVDHPGEGRLAEMKVRLDGGEGDVDDRRVEDDHQLTETNDEERDPSPAVGRPRYGVGRSLHVDHHYSKDYP